MNQRALTLPHFVSTALAALILLALPSVSHAALNAYLTLTCDIQGTIQGGSDISPHEGKIVVHAFGHNISVALDKSTGLPSGKRQHRPLRIIKDVDKSSPLLNAVMFNNENCPGFELEFYRPNTIGAEERYYTISLLNARIVSVMPTMTFNRLPENIQIPLSEVVSFSYQKITHTFDDGGITAEDDWGSASP